MPIFFDSSPAGGFESGNGGGRRLFKDNVKFSYMSNGTVNKPKPFSFIILPAFEEHDGPVEQLQNGRLNWVRAATLYRKPDGTSMLAANFFYGRIWLSKSFVKGCGTIVSRRTISERNADGSPVRQEDPLSDVLAFANAPENKDEWGYISFEEYHPDPSKRINAKLPTIKENFVMNLFTLDDDNPGVKVGVLNSKPAMFYLASTRKGFEGYAFKQTTRDISDEELRTNPSAMFEYGDITDPNNALVFQYTKGKDKDGKPTNLIVPVYYTDPNTGRDRIQHNAISGTELQQRVDLQHPETFVNVPTVEEQIRQICEQCCGRNKNGIHEYDMIRAAIPDYAGLIPQVPPSPGVVNQVRGASVTASAPSPAANTVPVVKAAAPAPAMPPPAPVMPPPATAAPPATAPVVAPPPPVAPPAVHAAAPVAAPAAAPVPAAPAYVPKPVEAPPAPVAAATTSAPPNVAGEATFDRADWVKMATEGKL